MAHTPPSRRPLFRRIPQEKLDLRYEANRALAESLASFRAQRQTLQGHTFQQPASRKPVPPPQVPATREKTVSMKRQVEAHSRRSCREQAATRLAEWGMCIRYRRVSQGIKAQALCERVGVSLSTLRRAERGDATVAASTYLIALAELSILGELLQEPSEYLLRKPIADGRLSDTHYPRSRIRKWERRTVWL